MSDKYTVILGAGAAGMSAAYELRNSGKKLLIVERNAAFGGLARTLRFGEFSADIGPHRFYTRNREIYRLVSDLLASEFINVNRFTRFYINGKLLNYPVQLRNILGSLDLSTQWHIFRDYAAERIRSAFAARKFNNFEDMMVSDFGRSLAELNMLNYTEKIWGVPCTEISTDWARQRIKNLSVIGVVRNMLFKGNSPKTLIDVFQYPLSGTSLLFDRMQAQISAAAESEFLLNSCPVGIRHDGTRITELVLDREGKEEALSPEHVITSIPLTELIRLLNPAPPSAVLEAVRHLRIRSHVSLFITLDRSSVFPDQWIYFPQRTYPFGRITEPRNFSAALAPSGKTSLLIEFFCWEHEPAWTASPDSLAAMALPLLEKSGFIKAHEVLNVHVHREKYAYPLYDLNYAVHRKTVMEYLSGFENLTSVGRLGLFKYNNLDHAIEMGLLAARSLMEGRRYAIDSVGTQQHYLEDGESQSSAS